MKQVDLVIIGGGPAGMAAAISAYREGIKDILILDREQQLGGILEQCIHNGFGLHKFKEELTGPEYAFKYQQQIYDLNIPFKLNTMVTNITNSKIITATNETDGIFKLQAKAIILAMGCRERNRGALNISGTRPAGIYTAGAAQKFVNIKGYLPGEKIVILGSGDIGLIMARRMTLEGAKVLVVCEIMPYCSGLKRNVVQCLDDYNIPLKLERTITKIHGNERVTGVTIAKVDENRKPIEGTYEYIECDTILLSVGLIPENELSLNADVLLDNITGGAVVYENMETTVSGIFSCGNVLHVHDLVDYVSDEADLAGKCASKYILNKYSEEDYFKIKPCNGVRYVVPQRVHKSYMDNLHLYFRVDNEYRNVNIKVKSGENIIYSHRKLKVAPGEMESINIPKENLKNIDEEIVICLEMEGK